MKNEHVQKSGEISGRATDPIFELLLNNGQTKQDNLVLLLSAASIILESLGADYCEFYIDGMKIEISPQESNGVLHS
jgi:hypothetical protein